MRSIYDKATLIDKISKMTIYEKDYVTIKNLINNADTEFVAAAIEEVASGNLYWSDFERVMPSEYSAVLSRSLENQKNITTELERLSKFRGWTNSTNNNELEKKLFPVGITRHDDENGKPNETWENEYKNERNDLLYELTSLRNNDTTVTIAFKEKLLNALENGKLLFESDGIKINNDGSVELTDTVKNEFGGGNITATAKNGHVTIYKDGQEVDTFLYINPNDILFSVDSYVIPVDYRYQVLNDTDKIYMDENGCTEEEIKKMKALLMWIKYSDIYKADESSSGGESDA